MIDFMFFHTSNAILLFNLSSANLSDIIHQWHYQQRYSKLITRQLKGIHTPRHEEKLMLHVELSYEAKQMNS